MTIDMSAAFDDVDGQLDASVHGIINGAEGSLESFDRLIVQVPLVHAIPQLTTLFCADLLEEVYDRVRKAVHGAIPEDAVRINEIILANLSLATAYRAGKNLELETMTVIELENEAYSYINGVQMFAALAPYLESLDTAQQSHLCIMLSHEITRFSGFAAPSQVRAEEYFSVLERYPMELGRVDRGTTNIQDDMYVACRDALFPHLGDDTRASILRDRLDTHVYLANSAVISPDAPKI